MFLALHLSAKSQLWVGFVFFGSLGIYIFAMKTNFLYLLPLCSFFSSLNLGLIAPTVCYSKQPRGLFPVGPDGLNLDCRGGLPSLCVAVA